MRINVHPTHQHTHTHTHTHKQIKNKATINENTSGTVEALQKQLRTLRQELLTARAVITASGHSLPLHPPTSTQDEEGENHTHTHTHPSTTNIHASAEYKHTQHLLKEALERSLRLEQARDLAEKMAANVQATVDR
jgi:hypothetical protein